MRLIDADWVAERLKEWRNWIAETCGENDDYVLCLDTVLMKLDDAPTADVEPVKPGHWINDKGLYKCSICNELWCHWWVNTVPIEKMNKMMRFCPNCGAKMGEVEENG